MHASVEAAIYSYNAPFEGVVPWFYADVKGLVTIGVGNLVDPLPKGLALVTSGGDPATEAQISEAWRAVKNDARAAKNGHRYAKQLTSLRMPGVEIDRLVRERARQNAAILRSRFPAYDTWPADAQLGVHSLAWACGAGFRFPRLAEALGARNWRACGPLSQMGTAGNPGLRPRNAAQCVCFENAKTSEARGLARTVLIYGSEVSTS